VPNVKIGIQTRSLRQPLRKALATAARLGADAVEIDARNELPPGELSQTGLRQIRKLLADCRLQVSAIAFPTRRGYDERDELERRILATQAAMRTAYSLGCGVVINRSGKVPSTTDDPLFNQFVEALTLLGACGERVGARLAATTGTEPPGDLARLLAALPAESVGVDLNPRGLIAGGHSPADALSELGRLVLHVHANDAVLESGQRSAPDVLLGRGTADFPTLVARLNTEFNYRGWITVDAQNARDPIAAVDDAIAYLRAL
jgi:sugar phosphate isomerase/epimerase